MKCFEHLMEAKNEFLLDGIPELSEEDRHRFMEAGMTIFLAGLVMNIDRSLDRYQTGYALEDALKYLIETYTDIPAPEEKTPVVTKKKVYISGKITGLSEDEAMRVFAEAEGILQAEGYATVNPTTLPHNHDKSWQSYMRVDIRALCDCDAIYMLPNWEQSKGAVIEHRIAIELGLEVMNGNRQQ
jgi:hypothetical protein